MSVTYLEHAFMSVDEIVTRLITLIKDGFENPYGRRGTVLVDVLGHPEQSFLGVFGDTLEIVQPADGRDLDARLGVPVSTLETALRDYQNLDWRSPEILGTLELEGNLDLVFHLTIACVRPSKEMAAEYAEIQALHAAKGHHTRADVHRLHQPSQKALLQAMANGLPTIVTGLEPEPPCREWTLDRLVEKYGDAIVCVRGKGREVTMKELAKQMRLHEAHPELEVDPTREKAYTEGAVMPHEMWDDFGPMFFDREDFLPAQLWLGSVSTNTPTTKLHCDPSTGFLFQVMGRKKLELFSANQADLLYPRRAYSYYRPCWYNPDNPDFDRFPRARSAQSISVILHPGELLVQPAGWFHQVSSLDSPNMSVSYFWRY